MRLAEVNWFVRATLTYPRMQHLYFAPPSHEQTNRPTDFLFPVQNYERYSVENFVNTTMCDSTTKKKKRSIFEVSPSVHYIIVSSRLVLLFFDSAVVSHFFEGETKGRGVVASSSSSIFIAKNYFFFPKKFNSINPTQHDESFGILSPPLCGLLAIVSSRHYDYGYWTTLSIATRRDRQTLVAGL